VNLVVVSVIAQSPCIDGSVHLRADLAGTLTRAGEPPLSLIATVRFIFCGRD
jgi:hypothetical protein